MCGMVGGVFKGDALTGNTCEAFLAAENAKQENSMSNMNWVPEFSVVGSCFG